MKKPSILWSLSFKVWEDVVVSVLNGPFQDIGMVITCTALISLWRVHFQESKPPPGQWVDPVFTILSLLQDFDNPDLL